MPKQTEELVKQGKSQNLDLLGLKREIGETELSANYTDCNNS